ncbi:MAG: DUF3291 domain-containing protein [Pseudomonadales bacterium]|jgi:hypothetical protein|nr:DUF3291 domain-containing protein [Pseudomonadales bacterium]
MADASAEAVWQLAQLNVARMRAPLDAPELADFVAALPEINALADAAPGFVWRLQTEEGDATSIDAFGVDMLVNLSVWADLRSLQEFVFRTAHAEYMRRRREWFERIGDASLVLWWVRAGHRPGVTEARDALDTLRRHGPTSAAFDFRAPFPAPGAS